MYGFSASRTTRFTKPIFLLNSEGFSLEKVGESLQEASGLKGPKPPVGGWGCLKVKPWFPNKLRKPARFCDAMVGLRACGAATEPQNP